MKNEDLRDIMSKKLLPLLCLALALLLSGCGLRDIFPAKDPYEGLVLVPDGTGSEMWVVEHEELPVNELEPGDFVPNGNYIDYTGSDVRAMRGIDVSEHQQEIDWEAVAADGVEFAMIRVGYRGYHYGSLEEDKFFHQNMQGAAAAGIRIGVYFFSQAISYEDAQTEARFVLEEIAPYDVTLPVCFDWEHIPGQATRTDNVDAETLSQCALGFTDVIREAGYTPMVYFFRDMGYNIYDLSQLKDLDFWAGAAGTTPDFYYAHTIWQYSYTGRVAGIKTDCDLDLYFIYPEDETPSAE